MTASKNSMVASQFVYPNTICSAVTLDLVSVPAESKQSPCSWLLPPRRGKAGMGALAGRWHLPPRRGKAGMGARDGPIVSSSRRRFHETEPNPCPMNQHDTSTTNKCMVRALGGYPTETRTCQADETQPHASRGQALEPNTKTPARGLQVSTSAHHRWIHRRLLLPDAQTHRRGRWPHPSIPAEQGRVANTNPPSPWPACRSVLFGGRHG